jgi:hypothetical protein
VIAEPKSSLAVVPWAELYSRLDASELSSTNEIPQPPKGTPVPVMFPPTTTARPKTSVRSAARPSPIRTVPRKPGWEEWLETPVIHLSHIVVLVVSGTMFGVGLSAFALEFLGTLPGLEFLKL